MKLINTLEKIADALQKSNVQDRLWSVGDIAAYVGFHENFVYQIKDRPDFPKPVMLGKQPRWIANEIKDWVKKQRG
jgi:predicted DNA-binding transcriptional regulator AlpA